MSVQVLYCDTHRDLLIPATGRIQNFPPIQPIFRSFHLPAYPVRSLHHPAGMTPIEGTEAASAFGGGLLGIGVLGIGVALGSALAALMVGYLVGRARVRSAEEQHQSSRKLLGRAEKQIGELGRRIAKMRGERDTVANLAMALPEMFRKLNRPDLDDMEVCRLIHTLASSLFQPDQFLLYWLDNDQRRLKLV